MIHLVTDSTAYLPPEAKSKYNVHTISLKIITGDRTYDEEGGITKEAFFKLLANLETTPTTSQPSVGEFVELYERLTRDGDEVLSVFISEGLSGTVPNARSAAQQVAPDLISVVDSRTSSIGLIIIVVAAGEAIAAGKSRPEVVAIMERMIQESEAIFMVEDLAYLHKGGRINTAARLLGTVLNIKPILYIPDGKIEPLGKERSSKKAKRRVLDEIEQRMSVYGTPPRVRVAVGHIQAAAAAEEMVAAVRERLDCVSLHLSEIGPVIGSHTGPGFLGVAACPVGEEGI